MSYVKKNYRRGVKPPPRRNSVKYDNTRRFIHVKGCKVNVESMKSLCDLVYWEVELEEYQRIL